MLAFKKDRKIAGLIISQRKPDQMPDESRDSNPSEAMEACAQDVYDAVHSNDIKKLAAALHAAFEIYDSMPHVEGEHLNEDNQE